MRCACVCLRARVPASSSVRVTARHVSRQLLSMSLPACDAHATHTWAADAKACGAQGLAARVQLRKEIGRARTRGVGRVGERMRESGEEGVREGERGGKRWSEREGGRGRRRGGVYISYRGSTYSWNEMSRAAHIVFL